MEQLWKIFHNFSYGRSVLMEGRKRAGLSSPSISTPITLHNYGPGPRATQRPRFSRPALESIKAGHGWAGIGAHERRRWLERGPEPTPPLPWLPWRTAALWKVFSGIDSRKGRSRRA